MTYWYAPGMAEPYWGLYTTDLGGKAVLCAHNLAADTDMGDLYGEEFHKFFPNAFEISEEQIGQINPVDGYRWAVFLKQIGGED